jgi:uncharacterized protein YjbI with pentapeptide repeats
VRPIAAPRLPAALETPDEHPALVDETVLRGLDLAAGDLARAIATDAEFVSCRFTGTDLTGATLRRAAFTDCRFERGNLANMHAERSSMRRVLLDTARLTGFPLDRRRAP